MRLIADVGQLSRWHALTLADAGAHADHAPRPKLARVALEGNQCRLTDLDPLQADFAKIADDDPLRGVDASQHGLAQVSVALRAVASS